MSVSFSHLNKEQYQAVTHPQDVPLQILAGPGSGKTKVLTSRVAYLVQERQILASQICCVTFTNKAANEMRERLKKLIGIQQTDVLVMGTFHALCARFLRKYGSHISLPSNFTICDAEESKKIISKIMKGYADELSAMSFQLKDGAVLASISKAKAKGLTPQQLGQAKTPRDPVQEVVARIYADYAAVLTDNNSLDFDDLLIFGVKLFTKEFKTVSWCRHVLVDEFQDTNSMQYELMLRLASAHRCVTVVGDPDQSIYGWRSAEVTNLGRMRRDFPLTQQILLEENYRSTGSILAASLAIVAEDKSRIAKSLRTSHPRGTLPTLRSFANDQAEAEFIAKEIKRLVAHHGGMLSWNDFVVLLRFNALSRVVESALQKEGIPNRVLAGHKFFERLEVKDILAYLQIIDNPSYAPAFNRAANTPPRGLGEKSISELSSRARELGISSMKLAERISMGETPDIKPPVKRKLEGFVKPIIALREMAKNGAAVHDLIRNLLERVNYEDHLKKSQQDWEARWENVQELINFATQTETGLKEEQDSGIGRRNSNSGGQDEGIIDLVSDDEDEGATAPELCETPLRLFLEASMLSTDTETKDENQEGEKVTISTCHSAKGLEWPVVFVPAVEQGTFPFYRTEDVEEERRLLYVACTRAQGFLYLSHSTRRMSGGEWAARRISEFVSAVMKKDKTLFSPSSPNVFQKERQEVANLLGREAANEDTVIRKIQEYNSAARMGPQETRCHGIPPFSAMNNRIQELGTRMVIASQASFATASSQPASGSKMIIPAPSKRTHHAIKPHTAPTRSTASGASKRTPFDPVDSVFAADVQSRSTSPPSLSSFQAASSDALVLMKSLGVPDQVTATPQHNAEQSVKLAAGKRRLGMGRIGTGYSNKRLKKL